MGNRIFMSNLPVSNSGTGTHPAERYPSPPILSWELLLSSWEFLRRVAAPRIGYAIYFAARIFPPGSNWNTRPRHRIRLPT